MEEVDLFLLLDAIKQNKCFVMIFVIIGGILGFLYNEFFLETMYYSNSSIILSVSQEYIDALESNDPNSSELKTSESETKIKDLNPDTYAQIIKSASVLQPVIDTLQLKISAIDLADKITVEQANNSMVIKITVEYPDPKLSVKIAKEIEKMFFIKLRELYNITHVTVLDSPTIDYAKSNISINKNVIIGAILGFIFANFIVVLNVMLNTKIKTERDVEENLKMPVLSKIFKCKTTDRLIGFDRNSIYSENFRILASNIKLKKSKTILITSNVFGEGKSWISANLAITYARSGLKTLLIDSDMRNGCQHTWFSVDNDIGLTNLIENKVSKEKLSELKIIKNVFGELDIITKGSVTIDYSKFIDNNVFSNILDLYKEQYDIIIIDGTPNFLVADGLSVLPLVDSAVIVVKYNNTKIADIENMKNKINYSGGNVLGVVINEVPCLKKDYENSTHYIRDLAISKKKKNFI